VTESDQSLDAAAVRLAPNAESVLIGHGSQAWQFGAHISLFGVQTA